MQAELRAYLDRVPAWRGRDISAKPLDGGVTNRNFLVTDGDQRFVLRVYGGGSELGIDRPREIDCHAKVQKYGIAPEIFYWSLDDGVMVTRFVEGQGLDETSASTDAMLARVVALLKRVHQGEAFEGTFSAFETVRNYHEFARQRSDNRAMPELADTVLEAMSQIEQASKSYWRIVPCHNDLLAANFIDDRDTLWLLDWEYAAQGDLMFDLGNFAVNQGLDHQQCERMLALYFDQPSANDRALLKLMMMASDAREAFWAFVQMHMSELDFDYYAYGLKHLQRFAAISESETFAELLALD